MGLQAAYELGLGRILTLERSAENYIQLPLQAQLRWRSSSRVKQTIFEKSSQTDFSKVSIRVQQGFLLYS
jgi:hypothetical protein